MPIDEFNVPATPQACGHCELLVTDSQNPFCERCGFDLRHGLKRATSGQCIYCESVTTLSDEHIYGKWLIKAFGRATSRRTHVLGRPRRYAFWDVAELARPVPKPASGDLFDSTVRNVCQRCNNNWMNEIHVAAQPLVIGLARGEWHVHSPKERLALTRWIVMIGINLECHGRILKTPQPQRTALMNGRVPDGWEVSFGTLQEPRRSSYFQSLAVPIHGPNNEPLYMNNGHFCIEHAVFHFRSSIGKNTLEVVLMAGGFSGTILPTTPLAPDRDWTEDELVRGRAMTPQCLQALEHVPGHSS